MHCLFVVYNSIINGLDVSSSFNYDIDLRSFDYVVLEKMLSGLHCFILKKVQLVDYGSWDKMYDILKKDNHNNVLFGTGISTFAINSSMIANYANGVHLYCGNFENLLICVTDDSVFVSSRNNVNNVISHFKDMYSSCNPHNQITKDNNIVFRKWGYYEILVNKEMIKLKKLVLNPTQQTSLQMHFRRSEYWIIIEGVASVVVDGEKKLLYAGESVYIARLSEHQIINCSADQCLVIIEMQYGDNSEDDIVRIS